MPTIAFWNTNKNVTPERVAALAHEHDADILILAENAHPPLSLQTELNCSTDRLYFLDEGYSARLTILTRFQAKKSHLIADHGNVSIRHYQMPVGESFLVAAAHLESKLRKKTEDQAFACMDVADYVCAAEARVGHNRTIVIGDLNMNPFESGMVASRGLNAVSDRRVAAAESRTVRGNDYTFFYNPMWNCLGDGSVPGSPPGTFYYNTGNEVNYYWNVFDQMLVRPALLDSLARDGVKIVTELKGKTLLSPSGRPNKRSDSDHLPIVCHLDMI